MDHKQTNADVEQLRVEIDHLAEEVRVVAPQRLTELRVETKELCEQVADSRRRAEEIIAIRDDYDKRGTEELEQYKCHCQLLNFNSAEAHFARGGKLKRRAAVLSDRILRYVSMARRLHKQAEEFLRSDGDLVRYTSVLMQEATSLHNDAQRLRRETKQVDRDLGDLRRLVQNES